MAPAQAFGDRGQIEMVVAANRNPGAAEDAIGEEGRRYFLQPEPGMADLARQHIEEYGGRKRREADTAEDHQHAFERIECRPFQVPVGGQHDRRLGAAGFRNLRHAVRLGHRADQFEDFHRVRAEVLGGAVLDGRGDFLEAALVDVGDELDADFL